MRKYEVHFILNNDEIRISVNVKVEDILHNLELTKDQLILAKAIDKLRMTHDGEIIDAKIIDLQQSEHIH